MNKYIIAILLCFLPISAWAFPGPGFIAGITQSGGAAVDYCANKLTGTKTLYYDLKHPDGTTTACASGGTTTTTWTATLPTADTSGDPYWINFGAATSNTYVEVPATGITPASGRIEFDVKWDVIPTANAVVGEWWYDSSNRMTFEFIPSAGQLKLQIYHQDGTGYDATTNYTIVSTGTTYHCIVDWKSTTNELYSSFNGSTKLGTTGIISEITTPTKGVIFGEDASAKVIRGTYITNIVMGPSEL